MTSGTADFRRLTRVGNMVIQTRVSVFLQFVHSYTMNLAISRGATLRARYA